MSSRAHKKSESAPQVSASKSKSKSSSHASPQHSAPARSQSASPHGSAQSAEQSAGMNDSGASSAHVSRPSKSDAHHSSAHKSSSKKSTVLPSSARADKVKSSSKKSSVLDITAAESHPAASSEKPVSSAPKEPSAELDGLEPAEGEPERTYGIVVDGWDLAKYHDRKGFRSVNVVRALKDLYKRGMKPMAFVPSSYVDIGSKTKRLADDPCVLKHIKERGFLQFTDSKGLYAWEMLTFAKNNNCAILSNRRYEQKRKVKTPKDVEVSPEELDELYEYVKNRRMTYSFKKVFDLD
ncbi:Zc3h12a-like Ribonuclease NYN [Gracilaria domingensis]|nr:Zc3h12a-like Ribonuclease NYN [Gracilaria domingensis]